MTTIILLILVIFLVLLITILFSLSIVGRNLNLFSSELMNETKLLRLTPSRWAIYFVVGYVWVLAKIHFPGTETIVTYSFDNRFGRLLRAAYWKCRLRKFGKDVIIEIGAKVIGWQNISIGDRSAIDRNVILETGEIDKDKFMVYDKNANPIVKDGELIIGRGCHISKNVVIQSFGGVFIGDFTGIASGAMIYSLSHHYKNMKCDDGIIYKFTPFAPPSEQSLIKGPVILEGCNALGLNSVILPGVTVGKNSWIGVCSYVVENVPPNSLAIGCPAKVVKLLNNKSGKC
jgi:acetyltransferase-like isoleucine patch superfamily enzyme